MLLFLKNQRELFKEMLKAAYKYSNSINARGEQSSTESLIISICLSNIKYKNHWYDLSIIINIQIKLILSKKKKVYYDGNGNM